MNKKKKSVIEKVVGNFFLLFFAGITKCGRESFSASHISQAPNKTAPFSSKSLCTEYIIQICYRHSSSTFANWNTFSWISQGKAGAETWARSIKSDLKKKCVHIYIKVFHLFMFRSFYQNLFRHFFYNYNRGNSMEWSQRRKSKKL